ncbi:MAG TPA: hypothetical protein VMV33_00170 [Rhodocyclaceae bacterium]|nr:hypothetical protein [Rhodocyclaceae bacterium]
MAASGRAHSPMRIFQVFINVDGLRIRARRILRFIPLPSWKRYGFYAVMLVAAVEDSKPPLLLALAREALVAEFAAISPTPGESWSTKMIDWRLVGAAPPLFQQPGCIDSGWGAAWYESTDEKAKQQRYRLTKLRLWQGQRAKPKAAQPLAA